MGAHPCGVRLPCAAACSPHRCYVARRESSLTIDVGLVRRSWFAPFVFHHIIFDDKSLSFAWPGLCFRAHLSHQLLLSFLSSTKRGPGHRVAHQRPRSCLLSTWRASLIILHAMNARPPKQSMSELKLRRLTEHNQRLREDLERPRVRVSEASSR